MDGWMPGWMGWINQIPIVYGPISTSIASHFNKIKKSPPKAEQFNHFHIQTDFISFKLNHFVHIFHWIHSHFTSKWWKINRLNWFLIRSIKSWLELNKLSQILLKNIKIFVHFRVFFGGFLLVVWGWKKWISNFGEKNSSNFVFGGGF